MIGDSIDEKFWGDMLLFFCVGLACFIDWFEMFLRVKSIVENMGGYFILKIFVVFIWDYMVFGDVLLLWFKLMWEVR